MLNDPDVSRTAALYLATTLCANLRQGGIFDYQRKRNGLTGYKQLPQFRDIANVNVGLFAQQAGLTIDEVILAASKYAHAFSSNARLDRPNGLDPRTEQFIRIGFDVGQSGAFDKPKTR